MFSRIPEDLSFSKQAHRGRSVTFVRIRCLARQHVAPRYCPDGNPNRRYSQVHAIFRHIYRGYDLPNPRAPMPLVLTAQESAEAVNGLRFQIGSAYLRVRGHGRYQHKSISPHVTLAWDSVIVAKQPIKPSAYLLGNLHSFIATLESPDTL